MRIGIIDLGSNSIRLVIYNWNGKKLEKKFNIKKQAQSVKFISNNSLTKEGVDNIVNSLKELMVICRAYGVDDFHIFATASLRNIENSEDAKAQIENRIETPIDILKGDEESIYGFEGMYRMMPLPLEGVSVDIGGGSTEITYFKNGKAIYSNSLPMGSLNMYLNHVDNVLPSDGEQMLMKIDIRRQLDNLPWLDNVLVNTVIGIGGTGRGIMRVHQAKYNIDTSIYDMRISQALVQDYATMKQDRHDEITRLLVEAVPDRLTTMIPGAMIMNEIMKKVQAQEFLISAYGVREGYLFNRILSKE